MKFSLLIIIILFVGNVSSVKGQEHKAEYPGFQFRNGVNTELGGHAALYSFNYERILINNAKFKTAALIGISMFPPPWNVDFIFPVMINEILSFNSSHIELGIGLSFYYGGYDSQYGTIRVGYRYQKPGGRFTTRFAFTPLVNWSNNRNTVYAYPWIGISYGYNFGRK